MSAKHFAFRHHGDLRGDCEVCNLPLDMHTHFVVDDDGPDDASCTVAPVALAAQWRAAERPEERGSLLAEVEERMVLDYNVVRDGEEWFDSDQAIADLRTLINEVKDNHRLFDEANDRMFADGLRITALEAEVKELREEKEQRLEQAQALLAASDSELEKMVLRLQDDRLRLAQQVAQVEEALREIERSAGSSLTVRQIARKALG